MDQSKEEVRQSEQDMHQQQTRQQMQDTQNLDCDLLVVSVLINGEKEQEKARYVLEVQL